MQDSNIIHNRQLQKEVFQKVFKELRVELDSRDEKMGYKIRESQMKKIPYTLVLGNNERDNNTVTYRKYGEETTTTVSVEDFISMLEKQIKEYK